MANAQFCICKCYFRKNIFIPSIKAHVEFENEDQFRKCYGSLLRQRRVEVDEVLQQIKQEIDRRKSFVSETGARKRTIAAFYKPLYPQLFQFHKTSFLHRDFLTMFETCENESSKNLLAAIERYRIGHPNFQLYQFPIFDEEFCRKLVEEIKHFSNTDLTKARPNTMNNYGVVLDEMGLQPVMDELRQKYLNSLSHLVFPEFVKEGLDSHRAFAVVYSMDGDRKLDLHFDNAETTLNVALNDRFEGGEIHFGGLSGETESKRTTVQHKLGWGILHRGRQLHSTSAITAGERCNLILWMRSSSVRNSVCPMCQSKPDLYPVEDGCYGDGFVK